jgi:hypothetical protein
LLPLVARQQLGAGPAYYGLLLACIGAGAASALGLPWLRRHLSAEHDARLGVLLSIVASWRRDPFRGWRD